ncbi:hypothetical protein SSEA_SKINNY_10 [Mycobacterium phage Skinny]|uniref:Uncharacterized protein n=6 Tax=Bongovirus bongo TaxID=1983750 RepID=A0A0M4RA61_9CAUD|nr:hypothetical protein PEGLEG_9 [Mycobacterium phage PegLeg]YP_009604867.1 hypothetical protein FDH95_gp009 [Mycobacterium phage Bongo]ALF00537.1 hypothetical protein SEA_BRICOLE_9 [Mycobacterium phage Bricole]AXQ52650.1 hypothetical protein SEA_IPHANE7_9 [Mycobacterium phage IPhane7]QDH93583.1 hypothetical protein SEA_LILHOMIEP_9 [Mycobacterium phage LilhomieP]QGJ93156.1 hypothetical protein SEA_TYDAWG_9 [Mycobacterium phage TyDawg]QUU29210.1 hypothetical protein [Mycobacterium phage SirShe
MSQQVSILVEYRDGKPRTAIGAHLWTHEKTRAYTRKGAAENYRDECHRSDHFRQKREPDRPVRDIRILTVTIPDEGPLGDGMWPDLLPEVSVEWA